MYLGEEFCGGKEKKESQPAMSPDSNQALDQNSGRGVGWGLEMTRCDIGVSQGIGVSFSLP